MTHARSLSGSQQRHPPIFHQHGYARHTHPKRRPNPPLNSDLAYIAFRSLSSSRFLGFVQRLGAGGAG